MTLDLGFYCHLKVLGNPKIMYDGEKSYSDFYLNYFQPFQSDHVDDQEDPDLNGKITNSWFLCLVSQMYFLMGRDFNASLPKATLSICLSVRVGRKKTRFLNVHSMQATRCRL